MKKYQIEVLETKNLVSIIKNSLARLNKKFTL